MARRAKQGNGEAAAPAEAQNLFDRYEIVEMNRSELKGADYNPRTMSEDAKKKLRAGIKKHGLIQPIIWNKRTGNVVGGHQRLDAMDALAGNPNYRLKVAVIDVDESVEKEQNVLLNNPAAMGDWDLPKLDAILNDSKVDLVGTGFDMADVFRLLGDAPGRNANEIDELAESLRKVREQYEKVVENSAQRDGTDFYVVVVFRDADDRGEFLKVLGLDDNRYQDGRKLQALLTRTEVEV